jgi:hypothetical protein
MSGLLDVPIDVIRDIYGILGQHVESNALRECHPLFWRNLPRIFMGVNDKFSYYMYTHDIDKLLELHNEGIHNFSRISAKSIIRVCSFGDEWVKEFFKSEDNTILPDNAYSRYLLSNLFRGEGECAFAISLMYVCVGTQLSWWSSAIDGIMYKYTYDQLHNIISTLPYIINYDYYLLPTREHMEGYVQLCDMDPYKFIPLLKHEEFRKSKHIMFELKQILYHDDSSLWLSFIFDNFENDIILYADTIISMIHAHIATEPFTKTIMIIMKGVEQILIKNNSNKLLHRLQKLYKYNDSST